MRTDDYGRRLYLFSLTDQSVFFYHSIPNLEIQCWTANKTIVEIPLKVCDAIMYAFRCAPLHSKLVFCDGRFVGRNLEYRYFKCGKQSVLLDISALDNETINTLRDLSKSLKSR